MSTWMNFASAFDWDASPWPSSHLGGRRRARRRRLGAVPASGQRPPVRPPMNVNTDNEQAEVKMTFCRKSLSINEIHAEDGG
jgi:hypothetical protein